MSIFINQVEVGQDPYGWEKVRAWVDSNAQAIGGVPSYLSVFVYNKQGIHTAVLIQSPNLVAADSNTVFGSSSAVGRFEISQDGLSNLSNWMDAQSSLGLNTVHYITHYSRSSLSYICVLMSNAAQYGGNSSGSPSPSSSGPTTPPAFTAIAGSHIPSGSVVAIVSGTAVLADSTTNRFAVGLAQDDTTVGSQVTIQPSGEFTNSSWNFDIGAPVYVSTQGDITQTPPVAGFLQTIGIPITSTVLLLGIQTPIELS